jgi:quinol monooxygenase YgiN
VIATVTPLPEHRAQVVEAFERAIARFHAEDIGCELYALHESDDSLVTIEKWISLDALQAHVEGAAVKEFDAALSGKLVRDLAVLVLTPHAAGDLNMGTV